MVDVGGLSHSGQMYTQRCTCSFLESLRTWKSYVKPCVELCPEPTHMFDTCLVVSVTYSCLTRICPPNARDGTVTRQDVLPAELQPMVNLFVKQVFGMDKKYWFIPAYSEEDLRRMPALQGLKYPTKPNLDVQ
ncbi:hypothetical protein GW17_00016555 [Ensete ventricosum]|nr:hypothetical protein GW17_00016555 [Ensete ventricosum]